VPVLDPKTIPSTAHEWYLSGPISGDIEGNLLKFKVAAEELRKRGFKVVSPTEVCDIVGNPAMAGMSWDWFMRRDIEAMLADDVKGIILLPGWENSRGARCELYIARALDYTVVEYGQCLLRGINA
jgi:hypothetical protein